MTAYSMSDVAMETGCASLWRRGWFRTVGADYGIARLEQAQETQRAEPVGGIAFVWSDARHLPFADDSFTVLINRRGPLTAGDAYMREGCRVLRRNGLVFEIGIGELDAREVCEVFGRGQMYGDGAHGPRIDRLGAFLRAHGTTPLLLESLTTRVRFAGREGLVFLLETTPLMPDFDRERDAALVDEVVRRSSSEGGVFLTMHRTIALARKD